MRNCDVVVVGAGPAGAILAGLLAARHCVILLERSGDDAAYGLGEALPPAAAPLLRDAGLQNVAASSAVPCYGNISLWGAAVPGETDFIFDPNGTGWHLDRAQFDTRLRQLAVGRGALLVRPCTVERIAPMGTETSIVRVRTSDGTKDLSTRVIVDASGRGAQVARKALGAARVSEDRLVCASIRRHPPASAPLWPGRTLVEATSDGWWYSMTLPDGSRMLAFLTDVDLPAFRTARSVGGFYEMARKTTLISATLEGVHQDEAGVVRAMAAHSACLRCASGRTWMAIGDAAAAFDPISSQGLIHALYTAVVGSEAIDRHLQGDPDAFGQYAAANAEIYSRYRAELQKVYRMETRWSGEAFWARRA